MDLLTIGLLLLSGFAAGAINALAGGGTIFTFSALLMTGIPPISANATSAIAVLPGQIAAAFAYKTEIMRHFRRLLPMTIVSAIGGTLGSILVLNSGNEVFRFLVPYLLLFATVLFICAPQIATLGAKLAAKQKGGKIGPLPVSIQGLVAVYGGYFGAGMGIMMLASLSLTEGRNFHAANAAKSLLASVMQGLAVIVFIFTGNIHYGYAILVAVASIAGGWITIRVGKVIPTIFIRWFVILTGLALSLFYFLR